MTTKPTCATRSGPVSAWIGDPPPGWAPGMRPPCLACGVPAGQPCKLPGEVWRESAFSPFDTLCAITRDGDGQLEWMEWLGEGHGWIGVASVSQRAIKAMVAEHERAKQAQAQLDLWRIAVGHEDPGVFWAAQQGHPWQCSGCGHITRSPRCPFRCKSCGRENDYTGSVPRADLAKHDAEAWSAHLRSKGVES